jgi:filamentous hemagglutinin family protein
LLAGTSAFALAMTTPAIQARPLGGAASYAATTAANEAASAASQQAAAIAKQSQSTLTRAVQSLQAIQQAARAAAQAAGNSVQNGLTAGGLVVDPRVTAGTDPYLWVNATLPTQSVSGGQVTVNVQQTSQRAVMTWQQFNIGKNTTVNFDQSGGNSTNGNNWVALNRIDATGSPSQIQGQIKADGTVLIINPNGIIFSGSSQINVHTLVASTLDINAYTNSNVGVFDTGSAGGNYIPVTVNGATVVAPGGNAVLAPPKEDSANTAFLQQGLYASGGTSLMVAAGAISGQASQGIVVQPGAVISTDVSGFDNGGYVALLGSGVVNDGRISTAAGQIILAAGSQLWLNQPAGGTAIAVTTLNPTTQSPVYTPAAIAGGAVATNDIDGLLNSSRGNITLFGDLVYQLGLAQASTSITRAGSITIGAGKQLTFGGNSVTAILPDENGEAMPQSSSSSFVPPSITINAANMDMQGSAGGQAGALILAPGATMTVATASPYTAGGSQAPTGRVLLENGSVINLAGLDATASVSDYLYTFKVTANDVADSPLAQSLIGQTVTIDLRLSGTRADGLTWVGSPLFSATGAGYLAGLAQTIDQRLTQGGSLSFTSTLAGYLPFNDVLQQAGSVINISGGRLDFVGGQINATRLLGSDGRLYSIGGANPFIGYTGIAGSFTVDHAHWGVTETWTNPLMSGSYFQPGYTDGISAGSLSVIGGNPVLEGSLLGSTFVSARQAALAQAATGADGAQGSPDELPRGGTLSLALIAASGVGYSDTVVLQSGPTGILGPGFTMASRLDLPTTPVVTGGGGATTQLPQLSISTDNLSAGDFSSISMTGATALSMAEGASLKVRSGGSIKLTGVTTIDGTLTAHAGSISLTGYTGGTAFSNAPPTSQVRVGSHALLDVSGLWVNDIGADGAALQGAAYINAGSVTIQTYAESGGVGIYSTGTPVSDLTQSIVLASGSVIDLTSGGYVQPNGKLKTASSGLPAGTGGSLSLLTYVPTSTNLNAIWVNPQTDFQGAPPGNIAPTGTSRPNRANVILDGTIASAGLAQGGTFTLQVPIVRIGGVTTPTATTTGAAAGELALPASFFASNGFSAYALTSTYGGVTVVAGTKILLQQESYLLPANAATQSSGALRSFATLGLARTGLRQPVDFTLIQRPYMFGGTNDVSTNAGILLDNGAAIIAEPQAAIALTAAGPVTVLGDIIAHGGSITLTNNGSPVAAQQGLTTQAPLDVWVGPQAVLDVSGTFVANPLITTYATGTALDGGTISLSGGTIVAMPGSSFDLAGVSSAVEIPAPTRGLNGQRVVTQPVWSDGGTLTLLTSSAVSGNGSGEYQSAYFAGAVNAAGGTPQASGGPLIIGKAAGNGGYGAILVSPGGDVTQSFNEAALAGDAYPTTATQLAALLPTTNSVALVTADTLNHSGFASVSLMAKTIAFSGNVSVKVPGALMLAGNIALLAAGSTNPAATAPSIGGTSVNLDAGYLLWAGNSIAAPAFSDGTLNVNASAQIDLAGFVSVSNAVNVNLRSGGDIRLLSERDPAFSTGVYAGGSYFSTLITAIEQAPQGVIPFPGILAVADNLTLTAREVYPSTDSAFLLMSAAQASGTVGVNTITIASNGRAPVAPLSANGEIVIDAPTIVQSGVLLAPLGTIQLGINAGQTWPSAWTSISANNYVIPAAVSTSSLTLSAGSVTSVTAVGLDIPYGSTIDGGSWTEFDRTLNSGNSPENLTAPPAKTIVLNGADVDTQPGARLDLRGGGDVYATEFVVGTGGSRNVLTAAGKGQAVYALVPSYEASVAPSDIIYGAAVAPGTSVTLPGGNGVAAGSYILMPAIYATLPGAYRVVVVSTSTNIGERSSVAADGSIYTTGILGNAITGSRSSQTALLEIQPNGTWTKYSEVDITSGNSYFAALAAANGTATPRLPIDAGQLVVGATRSLNLQASNAFAAAPGGRGGLADITGANLLVLAPDQAEPAAYANAGYVVLNSDQISNLGAESVMIGGTRTQQSDGTWVTPIAASVVVATDAAYPLSAPDLLLIANPSASSTDYNYIDIDGYEAVAIPLVAAGTGKVTVLPGSVVEAKGVVSSAASTTLHMGTSSTLAATQSNLNQFDSYTKYAPDGNYLLDNNNPITSFYTQAYSGGGLAALLEVSNGLASSVQRVLPTLPATVTVTNGRTFSPPALPSIASIDVGAGAVLAGGNALMLNGGNVILANTTRIFANNVTLAASAINFGAAPTNAVGLTLSPAIIAQLAGVQSLTLTSASVFNSYDTSGVSLGDPALPIGTLTLDGSGLYSAGGTTTISAGNVVLTDSQTTPNRTGALSGVGGHLVINAVGPTGSVTLGAGSSLLRGFARIDLNGSQQIAFAGNGSVDAGSAAVALTAPAVVAGGGSVQSLTTSGVLTIASGAGTGPALDPTEIGGALTLTASNIADSGTIVALAGQVAMTATTGDIALQPGARIIAAGSHIPMFDETLDTPGGTVKLISNLGNISIASGTSVDISATGHGFAGSLTIQTAPTGTVALDGTLSGGAAFKDLGGNFTLNTGTLAAGSRLPGSFTGSIAVTLQQGDILIGTDAGALAPDLSAGQITLAALNGRVVISGTGDAANPNNVLTILDASGRDGQIALFAGGGVAIKSGVRMTAAYVADDPSNPNYANGASQLVQNGGTITLGTSGTPNGSLNAAYGYENVDTSGAINVASNALFDVSGGPGGANISNSGGAVILRAPILTNNNVNVSFKGTLITNADSSGNPSGSGVLLDAYAVWGATDNNGTPSGTHFDGIIDPAGWYNADGSKIAGNTNGDIFTPTGAVYQNHVDFYQATLVNFVQNALDASALAQDFAGATGLRLGSTLHLRPEIDLISPSTGTGNNGGNITVASNWNLGAGSFTGPGGAYVPTYRTVGGADPGEPGVLSLAAANNVKINATVSDGFYETTDPLFAPVFPTGLISASYASVNTTYQTALAAGNFTAANMPGVSSVVTPPTVASFASSWNSADQGIWYGEISSPYAALLSSLASFLHPASHYLLVGNNGQVFDNDPTHYASYADYVAAYNNNYVGSSFLGGTPASVTGFVNNPATYSSYAAYMQAYSNYARDLNQIVAVYYMMHPTQISNLPSTLQAPLPPPAIGSSYETSKTSYYTDYGRYASGYSTYYLAGFSALYNPGTGYVQVYTEPGSVSPLSSAATNLFLVALPYAPPVAEALNPLINTTPPAAGPANQIANNPAMNGSFVDYNTTTAASLMPASVSGQGSFSYQIVAGAQFTSSGNLTADPNAIIAVPQGTVTTGANPSDSVTLNGHATYSNPNPSYYTGAQYQVDVPTVLRTGTGSITIVAAGSFELLDTTAPGAVYTAGVAAPAVDGFSVPTMPAGTAATINTNASYLPTGLVTNPVWGTGGGAVTIIAGQDIVGIETPVDTSGSQTGKAGLPTGQF